MATARAHPASARSDGNSTRSSVSSTERRISRSVRPWGSMSATDPACDGGLEVEVPRGLPNRIDERTLELVEPSVAAPRVGVLMAGAQVEARRAEQSGRLADVEGGAGTRAEQVTERRRRPGPGEFREQF